MNTTLLTKTDFQKKIPGVLLFPFEIRPLEGAEEGEGYGGNQMFRIHQNFKIAWIVRGRMKCRIDLQQSDMTSNDLVCIRPGKFFGFEPVEEGEGYLLSFTDGFLSMEDQEFDPDYQKGLSRLFSQSAIIPVRQELRADMQAIMERMQKESENIFLYRDQMLKRFLKIFLIYLSRHGVDAADDLTNSRGIELSQEFMALLEKNFKFTKSINKYAEQLSVTANHLNVVVKKNTGHTAGYHVKRRLILEAKRLAVYSKLCMKEIAGELGFSDSAHFSKFFKNCSGMNFTDFKKEHIRFPLSVYQA